jgi:predicted nucleotidyltransferase
VGALAPIGAPSAAARVSAVAVDASRIEHGARAVNFTDTLRAVSDKLDASGYRWAVIGGLAVGIYGAPRATVDIDVLLEGGCAVRLDEMLADLGYSLVYRWEESSHFTPTRPDRCPLDFLHARRPHSLGMLERAHRVELGEEGLRVPVVEMEDLVGLKVQAMVNDPDRRRGELVDIRALLEAAASLKRHVDMDRVREYFALFGEEKELQELMRGLEDALQ